MSGFVERPPVWLAVRRAASGAWSLSVGTPGRAPASADVSDPSTWAPPPPLRPTAHLPGRDGRVTRDEEARGLALAAAAFRSPAVAARWGRDAAGLVLVDGDPEADDVPWELLAGPDGAPVEPSATVARVAPGAARARPPGRAVAVVALDPDDPVTRQHADRVSAALVGYDLDAVGLDDDPDFVHVVAHGATVARWLDVATAAGPAHPASVLHALAVAVRSGPVVVLDVCSGAAAGDTLARRAIAAGARACLGPAGVWDVDAASTACAAWYQAIGRGASLAGAVAEARRAVRSMLWPQPEARWWRVTLWVASAEVPSVRRLDLASAALARAEADGALFVGVEHLAAAVGVDRARWPVGWPDGFVGAASMAHTPRLSAWLAAPPPEGWLAAIQGVWATFLGLATGAPSAETWGAPAGAAAELEVLGGPEDGRRIALTAGVLGRAGGGADVVLYADGATDPWLSRRHLAWTGDRARWLAPGRLRRGPDLRAMAPGDEVTLLAGDRVELGRGTVMVARAAPGDAARIGDAGR